MLVASDAIALGLNLQIRRVVLSSTWKFDGESCRHLTGAELRQVCGRAGRYGLRAQGYVACCQGDDVPRVREALEAAVEEELELQAALRPLPEQLAGTPINSVSLLSPCLVLHLEWPALSLDMT